MTDHRMMSRPQGALGSAWKSPIGLLGMMMRVTVMGLRDDLWALKKTLGWEAGGGMIRYDQPQHHRHHRMLDRDPPRGTDLLQVSH